MSKSSKTYSHSSIEPKWQLRWRDDSIYQPDIKAAKDKFSEQGSQKQRFYNLWMFPYPSGEGLHAGHAFASTGSDIYGRFMSMNGKEVFEPFGYDSFGIHAENYAIKIGELPKVVIDRTTANYEKQMKSLGHAYDWSRTVTTSDIDYYRWTQCIFVELFKAGLAYKKKASVNWCPSCKTVLADEQIMTPLQAGKFPPKYKSIDDVPEGVRVCERCGSEPQRRELSQWFLRITDYADRLLDNLDKIDWSERVVKAQREWIGKSEGCEIEFKDTKGQPLTVFTTRPDTIDSVTFLAVASKDLPKLEDSKEKLGEFTGEYAIHPISGKEIPIWEANYVSADYGTGIVMGVPAYDERDLEFAKKYQIDVIKKPLKNHKIGNRTTTYHLRDWGISRQRYWGPPIPMVYCRNCAEKGESYISQNTSKLIKKDQSDWDHAGWFPAALPVELPEMKDYQPEGDGKGPLSKLPDFYETKCPNCGGKAERETDVSDTFLDSSWYFLRYPTVGSKSADKVAFDKEITKNWLPVDLYFGGAEHSVLHLMYARFVTMALKDLKYIDFEEPFPHFYAHGLMIKDGAKMSKSRGNVVNPDEYVTKYGADALRLYLMFMGPMDGFPDFRDTGMEGTSRFLMRVWAIFDQHGRAALSTADAAPDGATTKDASRAIADLDTLMHQTIKKVTEDIQQFKYNTAIATIMTYVNALRSAKKVSKDNLKVLAQLMAPFAPHMMEEVWVEILGEEYSIHKSPWPKFDKDLAKDSMITLPVQINGKTRSQLEIDIKLAESKTEAVKMAQSDQKIADYLKNKKIKQTIFVPGKILNFVI